SQLPAPTATERRTHRLTSPRNHLRDYVNDPLVNYVTVDTLERSISYHRLVEEQAAAIRHLSRLEGSLVLVVGPGGSGKTLAIGSYAEAVRATGSRVIGAATSATAAANLGQSLNGCWTGTIALLRHHLERTGQPLPPRTVLLIDEASMVSTADLAWAVQLVRDCNGKLILIGDPRQLPPVDSGGLFHRLVAQGHQVVDKLASVNQRQTLDLDRENLTRLRTGKIEEAIHHYSGAERLHLGQSEASTKSAMVEAWWKDVERFGLERVRMLASRRHEVETLNQLARAEMSVAGVLTGPVLTTRWGTDFQAGDRVVVRDNWYSYSDLRNGQTGTITAVDPQRGSVCIRRDLDGQSIDLPRSYVDRNLDLAYAQTIHTAQGQSFAVTHLYADLGVKAEHGYTALSRARGETHLWLNDVRGPLGDCTYLHGNPLIENRVEALVRQLSQSVVEPPAHDQGIAFHAAGDEELVEARDQLATIIRHAHISASLDDRIAAFDGAITRRSKSVQDLRPLALKLSCDISKNCGPS
ncbi:MAG: ATP-dependent DNA helicase, partial [Acidimicrobiia bacterium]